MCRLFVYTIFVVLTIGVFGNFIFSSITQDPYGIHKEFLDEQKVFQECNSMLEHMHDLYTNSAMSALAFSSELDNILSKTLLTQSVKYQNLSTLMHSSDF